MRKNWKRRLAVLAVVVMTSASLVSCEDEVIGTIDNNKLQAGNITNIEASMALPVTEPFALNTEEMKDFVSLVNSFTLETRADNSTDKIGSPLLFVLKLQDGSSVSLSFFDQILTVDDTKYYSLSEGDQTMLYEFWDRIYADLPDLVLICKQYVDHSNFASKDRIDYSKYSIDEMTLGEYESMAFVTEEEVGEKNIDQYRLVIVGDTSEHDFAVLLVKLAEKKVVGYAPIK